MLKRTSIVYLNVSRCKTYRTLNARATSWTADRCIIIAVRNANIVSFNVRWIYDTALSRLAREKAISCC